MSYPYFVEAPSSIRPDDGGGGGAGISEYMGRLIKLIPADVLGLYLTVRGFWVGPQVAKNDEHGQIFLSWWPVICAGLVLLTRYFGARNAAGKVQWIVVAISIVSFIVYVFASGHSMLNWQPPDSRYSSSAVVFWVFIVPMIYKGSPPA